MVGNDGSVKMRMWTTLMEWNFLPEQRSPREQLEHVSLWHLLGMASFTPLDLTGLAMTLMIQSHSPEH